MIFLLVLSGCGNSSSVSMGGSSSVHPLANVFIEDYKAEYPGSSLTYDGPGSSKGVEGVKNEIYDFGFLSRNVKDNEKTDGMTVETIALDGIVIIIQEDSLISDLTKDQIKGIYTGKITNWKQVGGKDKIISVVSRDSASGTRSAFDELLDLKEEGVTNSALLYDSNGAVTQAVSQNDAAIGYISFETYERNKGIVKGLKVDGVEPSVQNVQNGTYNLFRPFVMVYKEDNLSEKNKNFLIWFEENIDRLVLESGFTPAGEDNE